MRRFFLTCLLITLCLTCIAQERKIPFNGILVDFNGKAIKKARIFTNSPKRYVTCTKSGAFGLINVQSSDTLKISAGDKLYNIAIGNKKSIIVRLNPQTGEIVAMEDEELYRKGFDHRCRRDKSTGTIISGETIRRSGRSNIFEALRGRIPGLNISNDGNPGGDSEVNIRGAKSIYGESTPLYIVDGIETESINDISVYDIDYVEILKDAHIYGARGANGAILVFTKQP